MTVGLAMAFAVSALAVALAALAGVIALAARERRPDPRLDVAEYYERHGESPYASVSASSPVLPGPVGDATAEVLFWARALRTQWADAGVTSAGPVVPGDAPLGRLIRAVNHLDRVIE